MDKLFLVAAHCMMETFYDDDGGIDIRMRNGCEYYPLYAVEVKPQSESIVKQIVERFSDSFEKTLPFPESFLCCNNQYPRLAKWYEGRIDNETVSCTFFLYGTIESLFKFGWAKPSDPGVSSIDYFTIALMRAIQRYNKDVVDVKCHDFCLERMLKIVDICDADVGYNPDQEAEQVADAIPAVDKPANTKAEVPPKNRGGRPKTTNNHKWEKEHKLVEEYKNSGMDYPDFAKKKKMTVKSLKRIVDNITALSKKSSKKGS